MHWNTENPVSHFLANGEITFPVTKMDKGFLEMKRCGIVNSAGYTLPVQLGNYFIPLRM
jgi:hypothetical protein